MPRRRVIGIHVTDPPIRLHDGDTLKAVHVINGGALYGRVLFTDRSPSVEVVGRDVTIAHCVFEHQGEGAGVSL